MNISYTLYIEKYQSYFTLTALRTVARCLISMPLCFISLLAQANTPPASTPAPAKVLQAEKDILKPYTIVLKGSVKGMPGEASGFRTLKKNSRGEWELDFDAKVGPFMKVVEHSSFNLKPSIIKPTHYSYIRSGIMGLAKNEEASFDWNTSQVIWKNKKKQWVMKLQNGALDKLSYQAQLRMDLVAGKKDLNYLIADDDKVYHRHFTIEGEEFVSTDAGTLKTIKVKINRDNNKRETYIWFAKDWDYIFVKLLQKSGNSEYTIEMKSAILDGKKVKGV